MEKSKDSGITIKLSKEKSEEFFYNSLCNGLSFLDGSGLVLNFSDKDYKRAKVSYIKKHSPDVVCYEDVLMEILRMGNRLELEDAENGEGVRSITIDDVHKKVRKTPMNHLMDMINENDDAVTAYCIIQTVFYGKVLFG